MRFVIGPDGNITSLLPVCTSMPDREVVRCVTEEYKPLTFPQPEGRDRDGGVSDPVFAG